MKRKWNADEMEMAVNFRAMRLSWVFVGIALLVWCIVGYIKDSELPYIPFIIFLAQNIIFFCAKLLISRRLTGKNGDEDNEE
jgi:cobalamin synthase